MALELFLFTTAWIGHACLAVLVLNNAYARPYPKPILKPFRLVIGVVILAFPLVLALVFHWHFFRLSESDPTLPHNPLGWCVLAYLSVCVFFGAVVLPVVTARRALRATPRALRSETSETVDYWARHGRELLGNGRWKSLPRVPGNGVFRVDFTDMTLALPNLPPAWDGLTILHLSDLHFHGTPSRLFFDEVMKRIGAQPAADVVVLAGDYVDTDTHHEWIAPLLGPIRGTECNLAVLGNHDEHHQPERVRETLTVSGYHVLGNDWRTVTIRGVECVAVGHEGPWYAPPPELANAPGAPFRLCVSHTPDNFYWGQANHVGLMLCGHVHGGQIRLPVIGSIFVPSRYSRRFDMGVFEENGTVMVVSRGLSGKEPLRFRCNPQVIRITLKPDHAK